MVAQNGQSIETGNAGHTRQRIKTKQKQTKNEHNVRWTPLSASKHKYRLYRVYISHLSLELSSEYQRIK